MLAIIKRELTAYFKNPIAYFVIGIYALLSAIIFTIFVLWNSTSYLGEYFGFWLFLVEILIISVLSMKFFAEEKKNKTDQLLLTSPVSLYGLVMGKYIGAMIIFMAATSINLIYVVIIDIFGNLDYGALFSNLIGTMLMCSTMIAIALFISSVTESQVVSAAGSLAVLLALMVIDFFTMFMPSILRTILSFFTIYSYYDDFTNGILNLPPIVYYLSMTAIFLFLTVRMLEKRRWN